MSYFMSSKKKLDITAIQNELRGNSAFFQRGAPEADETVAAVVSEDRVAPAPPPLVVQEVVISSPPDTTIPRHRETTISRTHDTILETTRRTVKQLGKEAATHRFTLEEKRALRAIEREYEENGIRTSENEITRISINYLIEDYKQKGPESILAKVLNLLHS